MERDAPASTQRHGEGQPVGDASGIREIADGLTAGQFFGLLNQELRRGSAGLVHEYRDQSRGHSDAGPARRTPQGKRGLGVREVSRAGETWGKTTPLSTSGTLPTFLLARCLPVDAKCDVDFPCLRASI